MGENMAALRVSSSYLQAGCSPRFSASRDFSIPSVVSISSKQIPAAHGKRLEMRHRISQKELRISSGGHRTRRILAKIATGDAQETLPPALDSASEPPPVFDGTTRLYISYTCPFAQRAWIARNYKGLEGKIELVPINLKNRPAWYKEKVYPTNKVPALEHNNEVRGESLDLLKYIDSHFEGPPLLPDDSVRQAFAEDILSSAVSFSKAVTSSFSEEGNGAGAAFDDIEKALSKFEDGPFFLGQFSLNQLKPKIERCKLVDIAYVPFIERYQILLQDVKKYEITAGRPNLALWIEEMNKIEAYTKTRQDPELVTESYKRRYLAN